MNDVRMVCLDISRLELHVHRQRLVDLDRDLCAENVADIVPLDHVMHDRAVRARNDPNTAVLGG